MKNNKAFTLIEMLISLVVAAILVLTCGVMASIGNANYVKVIREGQMHADIAYGFRLLENYVRESQNIKPPETVGGAWVGARLVVDGGAFGLYQLPGNPNIDFVHVPDISDETVRDVLISVPDPGMTFFPEYSITTNSVEVELTGVKYKIPFAYATIIARRVE